MCPDDFTLNNYALTKIQDRSLAKESVESGVQSRHASGSRGRVGIALHVVALTELIALADRRQVELCVGKDSLVELLVLEAGRRGSPTRGPSLLRDPLAVQRSLFSQSMVHPSPCSTGHSPLMGPPAAVTYQK